MLRNLPRFQQVVKKKRHRLAKMKEIYKSKNALLHNIIKNSQIKNKGHKSASRVFDRVCSIVCEDQDTQLQGSLGNYIAFLKHVAERRKEKLTQNAPNDTKIKIIKSNFEKT